MTRPPMRFIVVLSLLSLVAAAQVPLTLGFNQMAVDPTNSLSLWGATAATLYHSTDGGKLFHPVPIAPNASGATAIFSFAIDPQSGSTLFVIAQYTPSIGLLWRTSDGGVTWTKVDPPGAPNALSSNSRPSFFFNHTSPQTVYYQIGTQLYKSTDNAITWKLQQPKLPGSGIEINAANPNRMYCLLPAGALNDSGLAVSKDEGLTWTAAAVPPLPPSTQTLKSISGNTVISDPVNPDKLIYTAWVVYNANQTSVQTSGVFGFYSADGGQTFVFNANNPTNPESPYFDSTGGEVVLNYSFTQSYRSVDFGVTWSPTQQSVVGPYAFDPRNSNTVFGSSFRQFSSDGGVTWQPRIPMYFPAPVPVSTAQTLEAGTAYVSPGALLNDSDGNTLILSNPVASANTPWLSATITTYPGLETVYSYKIASKGIAPGSYQGQLQITSPTLPQPWLISVQLKVISRVAPQLHFSAKIAAGTGTSAFSGDNGPATQAAIECCTRALPFDPAGNLYLDSLKRVRRITPGGTIGTFAGTGVQGDSGDGAPATQATFSGLSGMAYTSGGLVVADALTNRLRIVGTDGLIHNLYNGPFSVTPSIGFLTSVAADSHGTLFLTDGSGVYEWTGNSFKTTYSVLKNQPSLSLLGFTPQNSIIAATTGQLLQFSTPANGPAPLAGTGVAGFGGDHGQARQALIAPTTPAVGDGKGNIFFGDGNRVRVILPSGIIETIAGDGDTANPLPNGADATSGSLGTTIALAIDSKGNLWVATQNSYIYELTPQIAPPAPLINAGGAVSLASGRPQLCPGAIFSIYGLNLAASTSQASSIPLPENLAGVVVTVNGQPVPLFYTSGLQINAQLPWDTPLGNATITVTVNGVVSNSVNVNVTAAAPDILQYNGNRAIAVLQNGSINSPANPAAAGSYLVIYLTGVGAVDQTVATGAASPSNPVARATGAKQLFLDGAAIPIAFLGLTPNFVGLGQLNVQIPSSVAKGDHTLVLTIGGTASNGVLISVK
jgi:uncharacterized protein (TIGR03437 family)